MNAAGKQDGAEDVIICHEVHKWYNGFHALRGITTTVKRGEVVVILGPSGSGKSTFIRTINQPERHERSDIVVNGIPLTDDIRNIDAIRRNIGMVFQSLNLFSHMTVMRNITIGPTNVRHLKPGEAEEAAMQLLERMGIFRTGGENTRSNSPPASSRGQPSPEPWRCSPASCCSTSRPRQLTPR